MSPQRIQQRRTAGWRKPEGARYVGRPGEFGNPFMVWNNGGWWADRFNRSLMGMDWGIRCTTNRVARRIATEAFQAAIAAGWHAVPTVERIRAELAHHDLMCWCPLPEPGEPDWCHGAVLLDLARGGDGTDLTREVDR